MSMIWLQNFRKYGWKSRIDIVKLNLPPFGEFSQIMFRLKFIKTQLETNCNAPGYPKFCKWALKKALINSTIKL